MKVKVAPVETDGGTGGGGTGGGTGGGGTQTQVRVAAAEFEPSQIQDLSELIHALLGIRTKSKIAMKFHVRLELGDGKVKPSDAVVSEVNSVLKDLDNGFRVL